MVFEKILDYILGRYHDVSNFIYLLNSSQQSHYLTNKPAENNGQREDISYRTGKNKQ